MKAANVVSVGLSTQCDHNIKMSCCRGSDHALVSSKVLAHVGGFWSMAKNPRSLVHAHLSLIQLCPQVKPTHVLNAAGLTGRPNVDWCEDHKVHLLHLPELPGHLVSWCQIYMGIQRDGMDG